MEQTHVFLTKVATVDKIDLDNLFRWNSYDFQRSYRWNMCDDSRCNSTNSDKFTIVIK